MQLFILKCIVCKVSLQAMHFQFLFLFVKSADCLAPHTKFTIMWAFSASGRISNIAPSV